MVKKVTEGITISVETFYQPDYSNPIGSEFMFAYRITIENNNIFLSSCFAVTGILLIPMAHREVEGEGVVGVQPLLAPGETYQYVSGSNLRTEIGKMYGTYQMENQLDKENTGSENS